METAAAAAACKQCESACGGMQPPSVTVGPPAWRGRTLRSIGRAERLLRQSRAGRSADGGLRRPRSCGAAEAPGGTAGAERSRERSVSSGEREKLRPQTTAGSLPAGSSRTAAAFPPPSLREQCAAVSAAAAGGYMRRVREVEGRLRRQAGRVTQEGVRLERERGHLEGALRGVRTNLSINRRSAEGRSQRTTPAETGADGADELLRRESRELLQLQHDLEGALRGAVTQLQALGVSSRQLLSCAAERGRVLELLPHSGSARGNAVNSAPISPLTPECRRAMEASSLTVGRSQRLRDDIRHALLSATARQNAAHCTVNAGLVKKIAETVTLQQHLGVTSAATRQAAFRKQRELKCIWYSHGRAQGPECSGDVASREKLDRPVVQVLQRHPGTQLPEAAQLAQGRAVLRRCLRTSQAELQRLQTAGSRLLDDLQGKRAAAQVDAAIVRMRQRQVDRRAVPSFLQQGAC